MIPVHLNPSDLMWAERIGIARMSKAKGKPKWAYKDGRSGVQTHVIGASAELAFCRAFDLTWPASEGVGRREPDVYPRWEIRWAGPPVLKVATNDPPERLCALVQGKLPNLEIVGYAVAGWAQRTKPLEDRGNRGQPAHFVPARELVPIEPGFHDLCPMEVDDWGLFNCIVCGRASTYAAA